MGAGGHKPQSQGSVVSGQPSQPWEKSWWLCKREAEGCFTTLHLQRGLSREEASMHHRPFQLHTFPLRRVPVSVHWEREGAPRPLALGDRETGLWPVKLKFHKPFPFHLISD